MISIIITAFKEPATIGKCIESIINQDIKEPYELIVSAPDVETQDIVKTYMRLNQNIGLFRDPGKGKTFALNKLLPKLRGEIFIFTDGDVYISEESINQILKEFEIRENVGCVTGRPVPQEDRRDKYGYWANFLFDSAHKLRKRLRSKNNFLECSGYLWGFKKGVISEIPLDVAEDTVVPYIFHEKGYKIGYAEDAKVYVKNVDNWEDWIKQKLRTTKAHETLGKYVDVTKAPRTKSFGNESKGIFSLLFYPRSIMELYWSMNLAVARLYMWYKLFYDTKIKNKGYTDGWDRVESTK
jgi:cellulose synthase/poly-beta-1,6-N-acetylglucosamine synthase-like glycosyltransferase